MNQMHVRKPSGEAIRGGRHASLTCETSSHRMFDANLR